MSKPESNLDEPKSLLKRMFDGVLKLFSALKKHRGLITTIILMSLTGCCYNSFAGTDLLPYKLPFLPDVDCLGRMISGS